MKLHRSALIVFLFIVGCAKQDAPGPMPALDVPPVKDENGWPLYEQPGEGFAIALPPDWTGLEVNPQTLNTVLELGLRANPGLKGMEHQIRAQVGAGMKFIGAEKPEPGSRFAASANVMKIGLPGPSTLDANADEIIRGVRTIPNIDGPVGHERVKLRGVEAERLHYVIGMLAPDGKPLRVSMTQYLLIRGKNLFALTLGTDTEHEEKRRPTLEAIAESFRLVGE